MAVSLLGEQRRRDLHCVRRGFQRLQQLRTVVFEWRNPPHLHALAGVSPHKVNRQVRWLGRAQAILSSLSAL